MSPSSSTTFRVGKSREMFPSTPKSPNSTESNFASRDGPLSSGSFSANSSITLRESPVVELGAVKNTQATGGSVSMPVFVPREYGHLESAANSRKGASTTEKVARATIFRKKNHMRQLSFAGDGSDGQIITTVSRPSTDISEDLGGVESNLLSRPVVNGANIAADGPNNTGIKEVTERIERTMILEQPLGLQNDEDAKQLCSSSETSSVKYVRGVAVPLGKTRSIVESWEKRERCNSSNSASVSSVPDQVPRLDRSQPLQIGEFLYTEKIITTADDCSLCETILQGHDVFINVVKSRLTKLQVVRHFWEHNGIKSAIDAVAKLPDLAVQVDVICVLMVKLDLCTLDVFLLLLPVLCGLLNSKIERHTAISIEMLLEFMKIFLPVILSTVTASSLVGVDLQAAQRLARSKECYSHLLKIRQMLPSIIRKGGQLAKNAQKLNLALAVL
ncbi:katanin p80 WD40 repeat-containing subunit B1-like protein isoform X1 [Iris pallida]|uniref:Katanin p80 WD40 repeat-containing subunit B1-like protein isoform X1 n=1 Tax=Iris pallida TaxID=29817 RepID=A0AAX6F9X2_IRIPA|nr:katanin p80 WD40 repeat-containing subunit B1-like protein isoform X1 [Iris pallida]